MKAGGFEEELRIDLADDLSVTGARKSLAGSARLEVEGGYDITFLGGDDVAWDLELRRVGGGVEITGRVSGVVELECARCLEVYDYPFSIKVSEHALWLSKEGVRAGDDYGEEYMVMDGVLDLVPVLRDVVGLSFPTWRICADECRGLCPVCGANLNMEGCDCPTRPVDARLRPLEELKKKLEKENP